MSSPVLTSRFLVVLSHSARPTRVWPTLTYDFGGVLGSSSSASFQDLELALGAVKGMCGVTPFLAPSGYDADGVPRGADAGMHSVVVDHVVDVQGSGGETREGKPGVLHF